MTFYLITVEQAWIMANGKCQCKRLSHGHDNARCNKQLVLQNKGGEGSGAWSAHHINPNGGDILSNCEILCRECQEKTDSIGMDPAEKYVTAFK